MAFDPTNWLDIWGIYKYEIVGDLYLAIFLAMIVVFYFCARFNFDFELTTLFMVLFGLVISAMELGTTLLIYSYTVLAIGVISYYLYSQVFKRG